VERQDAEVACVAFVLELTSLGGRDLLGGRPVVSILRVD